MGEEFGRGACVHREADWPDGSSLHVRQPWLDGDQDQPIRTVLQSTEFIYDDLAGEVGFAFKYRPVWDNKKTPAPAPQGATSRYWGVIAFSHPGRLWRRPEQLAVKIALALAVLTFLGVLVGAVWAITDMVNSPKISPPVVQTDTRGSSGSDGPPGMPGPQGPVGSEEVLPAGAPQLDPNN